MVVYEIARWSEVFETSESRKLKSLPWIAERTDFTSTGWQSGLDEFGPAEWPAIYGAWMVIVRTAATAKNRGRLCGDKGEPWSASRIARPSGICPELIARAFNWAVRIGWLLPVEITSGDSPGNLPERRENPTTTGQDRTGHNKTERNGTEPTHATEPTKQSVPVRADDLKTESPKPSPPEEPAAGPEPEQQRPVSLKLHELAKISPFLQELEAIPVSGSGKMWHGSVFSADRLKPQHVTDAPAAFWLEWYRDQLTADSPVLRCGNQAEAAFVLAAVFAVRRASEASLKGAKRIARLIHWLKSREASAITMSDVSRAADEIAKHFGTPRPKSHGLAPAAAASPVAPAITPRLDPSERAKPKGRKFLNQLSDKLKQTSVTELEPIG